MNANNILYISDTLMKQAQENYAASLRDNDTGGMLRESGSLYRNYARTGNKILARKWTDEYIRCWLNQDRNPPSDGEHDSIPVEPTLVAAMA